MRVLDFLSVLFFDVHGELGQDDLGVVLLVAQRRHEKLRALFSDFFHDVDYSKIDVFEPRERHVQ